MAYQQMENLGGAGQDRQISIFTTANLVGAGAGGGVLWVLSGVLGAGGQLFSPGWFVQVIAAIIGLFVGGILTMHADGIPLYERLLLLAKYRIRRIMGDHIIRQDRAVAPRTHQTRGVVTIYRDGAAVLRPYHADAYPITDDDSEEVPDGA
jgi:hypothetical protein